MSINRFGEFSVYCPYCRKEYPEKHDVCPQCGEDLVPYARVSLTLEPPEAVAGGKRTVPFPGMYRPVTISLIPGLRDGQTLHVRNARFSDGNDWYDTGVLEIDISVREQIRETEHKEDPEKSRKNRKKKRGGAWARLSGFIAVLPVTVLMTVALYYYTAREVFEAAGKDELLVLAAMSFGLLLLLDLTVCREENSLRRRSLIFTFSLLSALLLRYAPPVLGVDLTATAQSLHDSVHTRFGAEPGRPVYPVDGDGCDYVTPEPAHTPVPALTPAPAPQTALPASGTSSVIPNFEHRYFLNRLSPEELDNFTALYTCIASFQKVCVFPHEISRDSVDLLTTLILTECPELMQVDFTAGYFTLSLFDDKIRSMDIPYAMTKEEYRTKYAVCRTLIDGAVQEMRGMDIFQKEKYVYELIVHTCSYSVNAPDAANAYGALIAGHAKCDGISLAAKWLLEESGVTAVVLTGQEPGVTVGHAWNAVLIDGVFCHLDITNDTENDDAQLYPAFNVPEHCLTDQYPYDDVFRGRFPLPSVQDYSCSLHYRNGCFIPAGQNGKNVLVKNGKAIFKKGGGSFTLQFETEQDYRSFLNGLDGSLSSLYYDTLKASGHYAYNMLDSFRTVKITLSFN